MPRASKLLILCFGTILLAAPTHAQSPREHLTQMVTQLQATPADDALRENIIKLALTLDPPPAVPDEALTFEGRAQYAFSHAASPEDYLAAAREYEKAATIAPWVCGYYSDLCTIYEKAGKLEEAKRNCEMSLAGTTEPTQSGELKRRIAGLAYGIEQQSPEAVATRKREENARRGFVGFWQRSASRTDYFTWFPEGADGIWYESAGNGPPSSWQTIEIARSGESYTMTCLSDPWLHYVLARVDSASIVFTRAADCTPSNGCDTKRFTIDGEDLHCDATGLQSGTEYRRAQERWVRRESCIAAPTPDRSLGGSYRVECR